MFQEERIKKIYNYLQKEKRAKVKELSETFGVSKVTIRRDLDGLLGEGLIIKTHGGAMITEEKLSYEIPFKTKANISKDEKQKIGYESAKLIQDNDTIIIDSGSTTLEIAKRIDKKNITVITNDINIAMEVTHKQNVELIVAGGILKKGVYTLVSVDAIQFFKNISVNKTFLGCDAIDIDFGISNYIFNESKMKLAMVDAAQEVIIVCDKNKFDKKVAYKVCDIVRANKIVTDDIEDKYLDFFKKKKIEVILAK